MSLTRQQLRVVSRARRRAVSRGATRVEKVALTMALGVESNYEELTGGDRDSTGALQQRPSQGWGPVGESLEKDVDQFLAHARQYRGKINNPGELAQAVQRSAFPGRYAERGPEARQALRAVRGGATPGPGLGGTPPKLTPASTTTDHKSAMLAALLDPRKGMSLLDRFNGQVATGEFTNTTPAKVTPGRLGVIQAGPNPSKRLERVRAEADRIDAAGVPYLWGGGHGAKQARGSKVTPLDCSGAVSRVLGINPRVASEFMKWGKPGRGKNITVWAKSDHVLVEIGGHLWGTSGSRPGGGAGWIDPKALPAGYLKAFTPRHPG